MVTESEKDDLHEESQEIMILACSGPQMTAEFAKTDHEFEESLLRSISSIGLISSLYSDRIENEEEFINQKVKILNAMDGNDFFKSISLLLDCTIGLMVSMAIINRNPKSNNLPH